ncbi:hypothetical protein SteCoe_16770 [Stentor coeruleus]|uniref:Uncharacterized protein n=1 Tax=Stentor coeruleus TaxID=5963 RepID=A0A1R2C0I8_9CILI|nr:hypothetical protein SteCoe_16770 [Stentor coeruleus]
MSRQLISEDRETSDMVQELERSYRERLANIDYKAKQELTNYEALDESLRRQLSSLREEMEMRGGKSSKVVQSKKSQMDQTLDSIRSEKDKELAEFNRKLTQSKDKYFRLRQDFDKSKNDLFREKSELDSENLKLRGIISDLTKEIEVIQARLREVYQKDIQFSRQEIISLKGKYEASARKLQQEHNYEARELEFRIENYERTIENLMYDIEALKREEEIVKQQTARDISYLRESLTESNKEVERCEEQTVQLLRTRDEAKEDSLMLSKVTGELETELGKEMKINTRLNGKLSKLERLVYGRGTRSPSKNRLN